MLGGKNPRYKCTCAVSGSGTEKAAGSQGHLMLPSVAREASVTLDKSQSVLGSGTHGVEISGSGEGIQTAASKPKNVFYFEVVLWIFPNPTSVERQS